jgi:hypothetical protein
MTPRRCPGHARKDDLSRPRFSGLGTGTADAVALGGTSTAALTRATATLTPAGRFGRMFPDLPPFVVATGRNRVALIDPGSPVAWRDAKNDLSAGPVHLRANPGPSRLVPRRRTNLAPGPAHPAARGHPG